MSFSYEKWKETDTKRQQQQATPKITPYEEWSRQNNSSKANMISKGLTGMSMEEYRKKNTPPPEETKPIEPPKENKTVASVSNKPPKESKNFFSKTWDSMVRGWNAAKQDTQENLPSGSLLSGALVPSDKTTNDTLKSKVGTNLRAGTGDFIKQTGEALKYLGADKVGTSVADIGASISDGYGEAFQNGREFTWSNLLNPEYYATNVARQVPQMATMVLGGGVGLGMKAATSLTKLPTLAQTIIGVAGGAGAMTTLESAMEAGGVYEEAKQRGMTEEQAKKAADETFKKNLGVTGGTSLIELGLGMTPLTRGLSRAGITKQLLARGAGGALSEGLQEGVQEKISTEELGDKFSWTDPSTVEAMVIGGLLGGTTTAGMAGIQAGATATANTRASLDNIARNTIDSLSNERRAEFDELVSVHREQGKSFNEAQLDALEDLASRYNDVVESARQSTRSYIDNEKLQRAQNAPVAERLQQEQIVRNTMNYEYQNQNNYQFNPAAIADNTNVLPEQYPTGARNLQPQLQNLMAQPQEAATQASVNTSPNANTFNMTIPDMDTTLTAQPQTLRNLQALNSPSAEQSNISGTSTKQIPVPTKNEAFKDLQTGDEIKLKGTKATTSYTVVEDGGGKSVKVETVQGKTIQVPRSSIEKILMRQSEANVMADPIEDTAITVKPFETNAVQLPEQMSSTSGSKGNDEGSGMNEQSSNKADHAQKVIKSVKGKSGKAYTEAGTEIQFRYEVVDAKQLTASHDTALRSNKKYPSELQPRDRTRQASRQQVTNIAQKLNPELVAESAKASDGAPIVSDNYIVESGNGRTIAMQKMYEENYDTGKGYKDYLTNNADKLGLDANQVKAMKKPVLVRVRTNEVNRQSFVEEANVSNVATMSSTEQATADAKKLTNKVMYLFSPSDTGDLNTASNRAFISQFVQSVVPQNERAALMTADGALSQDGLRRVQNAILAKTYGNSEALMLMIESNDNNVKTLTNALLQAAPAIVKMKDDIQNGIYYKADISPDIVAAVEKFSELRRENITVETFLNQGSLFEDGLTNISKELLQLFEKGVVIDGKARKSTKAYKNLIDTYVEVLQAAGNPNQQSLFENDVTPTKADLLEAAIKKVRNEDAGVQSNLFENQSENSQSSNGAGRATKSSNTDTFVGAKGGKRKQDQVNKGETTRAEIIRYIKDNFNVRVDIGQYRQRAKGVFKNKFAIIRTKDYADFEVIAHELGHRFDMKNGWSSDPSLKKEWIQFAEANLDLPKGMTALQKSKEGVAEYFRQYLYNETNAPVSYTELSDHLHDEINKGMKKAKWDKPLAVVREKMLDWQQRDAEQELKGVVAPIGRQKSRLTAQQFITKYYTRIFEKEHPIYAAVRLIEKELNIKIEGRLNPYQMAVLTRGTVARAATFIKRETFNSVTGERTGESLESILKDVDDVEGFGRYLVARHGLYLMEKKGKEKTPLSPDLMKEYLEKGKHYEAQAERIYKYQDRLLDVLVEGNLIPKDLPGQLRAEYPYYVPFYRVMTETGEKTKSLGGGGRSQQYVNQQQGIKRMSEKGSARNIVNPIESIIRNTHLYFGLADRNAVGFAMSELADPDGEFAAEVTRDIIEEIPSKMKLHEGQLEQIKKTLLDAGLEKDMMEDLDMEATFKLFEPMFRPNSSNNEILVWKEGKPKLYKIHDELLYNSLIAYDSRALSEAMGVFFKPLEASNNLLRSGITASPYFTIRTFWRSLAQIFVKTEAKGINYVTHPLRVFKGIASVAESRFRNNDAVTEWWKSGGAQSTFIAVENKYLDKELSKVTLNKKARNYLRSMKQSTKSERRVLNWYLAKTAISSPLHILQTFNDTLDQGIKLAEYQVVKKQTGSRQTAALASREADVDYKRFGSSAREFNKLTLFFNVSLQGPDNVARTFAKHPFRTSVRALTLITLPTLFLYALNRDDEEYQELDSWEKDMNWMIPMGNGAFVKVPVPFEMGVMFKTIPEKMFGEFLDVVRDENKQNFDKFYGNALSTMHPTLMPTLANVWYSYLTERSLNFNRDFVPRSLQGLEKAEQYTENTSEIMKFIAKHSKGKSIFGIDLEQSPIVMEETLKAQLGQMGQFYLWGADKVLVTSGAIERPDTKDLKRSYTERYFTSSINDGGTDSITNFYEVLDKKERAYKTHGQAYNVPADLKLYRDVQKDMSTLRKLRDAMMYNKMLDANDQPFSKEIKKDHVDTINKALRDMARYARFLGEDENITGDEQRKAYEKGIMDKDNFQRALQMKDNFERYQKARDKELRREAKLLKLQRQQQNNN